MFADFPVISKYTRADLIRDGGLVDVTSTAREAGFKIAVGITRAAYEDCVAWSKADNERKGTLNDEAGRLWDVVWMAYLCARRHPNTSDARLFTLIRVPRNGRGHMARRTTLKLALGSGDAGEPVFTIMMPDES